MSDPDRRPSELTRLRVTPWTTSTTVLLAVALGVQAVATAVVVDAVDGSALGAALAAGAGVVVVVLIGGAVDASIRQRRVEGLAAGLRAHATGGDAPDDDDPLLQAGVAVVAELRSQVGRAEAATAQARSEAAADVAAARAEATAALATHADALATLAEQAAQVAEAIGHGAGAPTTATDRVLADIVASIVRDAVGLARHGSDGLDLAPVPVTVEALGLAALEPLAEALGPAITVVLDGVDEVLDTEVTVDVARVAATLRTLAWGVVGTGADTLTLTVEAGPSEAEVRFGLTPVAPELLGSRTVDTAAGVVEASGGALSRTHDTVLVALPAAPWSRPSDVADQLVDVVDEDDDVVGTATRAEIRAQGLRHRAVYVVVRTSDDGIVVHRRADWKDVYPGAWDCAFGGVLDAGESWDAAAVRELAEEAGITAELAPLGRAGWVGDGAALNGRVYVTTHDGPYPCPDGEVVEIRVVPRAEVAEFIRSRPHCTDSADIVLPLLERLDRSPAPPSGGPG